MKGERIGLLAKTTRKLAEIFPQVSSERGRESTAKNFVQQNVYGLFRSLKCLWHQEKYVTDRLQFG